MNKRDGARILALGCHPVHTYSCLFALAAPRWHLEHLFRPVPCVSSATPSSDAYTYIVTYLSRPEDDCRPGCRWRMLSPWKRGTPRKFMSNSRRYFTPLSHVRAPSSHSVLPPPFLLLPVLTASSAVRTWKEDTECDKRFFRDNICFLTSSMLRHEERFSSIDLNRVSA